MPAFMSDSSHDNSSFEDINLLRHSTMIYTQLTKPVQTFKCVTNLNMTKLLGSNIYH